MAIEFKLLRNPYALWIRSDGEAGTEDTDRLFDFFSMLEEVPENVLLDWSAFKRASIGAIAAMPDVKAQWTPSRIAVLAPAEKEDSITLIIQRTFKTAEVRRFEVDEENSARDWLNT
jgi:hypothetical protein